MKLLNPICVALDVDDSATAFDIAQELKGKVGAFKVGPRLTNTDSSLVSKIAALGCLVFVDHKYYDIPSTMEAAVRSVFNAGATFVTIHASSGKTALAQMAHLETELNKQRPFKILAVTVLTSFASDDFVGFVRTTPIAEQVKELAAHAIKNGVTGIVCSPHEISTVKKISADAFIVTPGIRTAIVAGDDQKRTLSAAQAVNGGASMLVIGRPILLAQNREVAVNEILKELA
jgi:orotidine-5'-phosphate decarboxylase